MTAAVRLAALAASALLLAAIGPTSAIADLAPSDITVEVLNAAGEPESRAGAHPDILRTRIAADGTPGAGDPRETAIDFPPGFGGSPNATPACPRWQFETHNCPPETQIGEMTSKLETDEGDTFELTGGVYNLEPGPNEVAVFGGMLFIFTNKLIGSLRPSDFGLTMTMRELPQTQLWEQTGTEIEFWGVPADHQEGTSIPRRPFLTLPTRCDGPLAMTISNRTWQEPDRWSSVTADTGIPITGCGELPFRPQMEFGFENPVADEPTGAEVTITTNPSEDPGARVESHMRSSSVTMPAGTALSLGRAKRLAICTDAQFGLGQDSPPSCPPAARVGTLEADAPQLAEKLAGKIYIGEERPGDRLRIFAAAEGAGTQVKLVGSLRTDPVTGRLTTVLENLPEVPFGRMTVRFDGGPQALLVSPIDCGVASADSTFVPYSGTSPFLVSDTVEVKATGGAPCRGPAPFTPSFVAGGSSTKAGKGTAVTMTMRRRDGEQMLDRFGVTFPKGLSASLGQVQLCSGAAVERSACPPPSRVGSAIAEVGSGPEPAALHGAIYMTGPYKGAPFGMAIVFSAKLGPFDFGSLMVRSTVALDPFTGQVSVESDPLPRTFEGVPLRFQTVGLDIDRKGFMRNPTSCAPAAVKATVLSTEGARVAPVTPFKLRGCVGLSFRPDFSIALSERSELHRGGRPGLRIRVRSQARSANLRTVDLSMPSLLELGSDSLTELCSRRRALTANCPAGSRVGTATARSPLLDQPMTGGIYVAQPLDEGEPDLWTHLKGRGVELNVRSRSSEVDGRLHTKLSNQADMPLSTLTMSFAGGRRGIFSLARDLCVEGRPRRLNGEVVATGHNGGLRRAVVPISAPVSCGGAAGSRVIHGFTDVRAPHGG